MSTADIHPGDEPVTPVAELRAAAAKLRETGKQATAGPWEVRGGNDVSSNVVSLDGSVVIDGGGHQGAKKAVVFGAALHADAAWIVLVSPALAEPLAVVLEAEAELISRVVHQEALYIPALATARVINRSTS